jgi:hypothetical protein
MINIKWWRMNTSGVTAFCERALSVNAITTVRYEMMCTLPEETC